MISKENRNDFALIFDMDGVIVNNNEAHKAAIQRFCRSHGKKLTDEELRIRVFGRTNRDWLQDLFNGALSPAQLEAYAAEKEALYREIYAPEIQPVAGLIDLLEILEAHGVPRAIATSAPEANICFTLDRTGTARFFETIIDETRISRGKPDPEIYLLTARTLGYPPERCIVFEDSLSGIASARNAGCKVIGLTTTHTREELSYTDAVVDDFREVTLRNLSKLFQPK